MPPVKFGLKQYFGSPTPAGLNRWVRIVTVMATFFTAWMQTTNWIGPKSQNMIGSIIALIVGLMNIAAPMWGVQVGTEPVPADQVTAMETNPNY